MRFIAIVLFGFSFFTFGCSNSETQNDDSKKNDSIVSTQPEVSDGNAKIIEPAIDNEIKKYSKNGISLVELKAGNYESAKFELSTKKFSEGLNNLSFVVENIPNYNIAIIENNNSLSFFNQPNFKKEFLNGNNVFLAFLTDQNQISIKKNNAHLLKNVIIGDSKPLFDMNVPHLFFFQPQQETAKPILDFYLVNTSISTEGNKAKVTINNIEFIIDKWAAYTIEGLTSTENTIRIQLIDKNNKVIDGPFNDSGDRSFKIIREV